MSYNGDGVAVHQEYWRVKDILNQRYVQPVFVFNSLFAYGYGVRICKNPLPNWIKCALLRCLPFEFHMQLSICLCSRNACVDMQLLEPYEAAAKAENGHLSLRRQDYLSFEDK